MFPGSADILFCFFLYSAGNISPANLQTDDDPPAPPLIHSNFESYCLAFSKANNIIYRPPPSAIGQEVSEPADMLNSSVDCWCSRKGRAAVAARGEEKQTSGVQNDGFVTFSIYKLDISQCHSRGCGVDTRHGTCDTGGDCIRHAPPCQELSKWTFLQGCWGRFGDPRSKYPD